MSDIASHCYQLQLTPDEVKALEFVGDRYEWAYPLYECLDENNCVRMAEHEAWEWRESVDEDDSKFSLASSEFADKLQEFYDSII